MPLSQEKSIHPIVFVPDTSWMVWCDPDKLWPEMIKPCMEFLNYYQKVGISGLKLVRDTFHIHLLTQVRDEITGLMRGDRQSGGKVAQYNYTLMEETGAIRPVSKPDGSAYLVKPSTDSWGPDSTVDRMIVGYTRHLLEKSIPVIVLSRDGGIRNALLADRQAARPIVVVGTSEQFVPPIEYFQALRELHQAQNKSVSFASASESQG